MRRLRLRRTMGTAPRLDSDSHTGPVQRRHALLINPFYPKDRNSSFGKHVLTPSQALISIAAATPPNWSVRYWDENLGQGPPPTDPFPEVVGITVHLTFARRAYALAEWFRQRGARAVLGGLHTTACPREAMAHADALAVGEGVQLWPRILRDVEQGTLRKIYRGDYYRPYRCDLPPRRDLVSRRDFLTTASLSATRGCHNRCRFCYLATDGLRMPYQRRDAAQVVDELAGCNQPYGVFIDNNLGSDRQYLRELCRALRPLEKIWSAAVSVDVAEDAGLVREMGLAGCTGVFVGFETVNDENLRDSRKRSPKVAEFARCVRVFHDNGIQVNGSFVFGFDHDRADVFERTVEWIEANRLECATFHILTPYPGTPLFRQLEREGRLLHEDWDLYDTAHVVFRPRHMTPERLAEGYAWCYRRLFSHASVWRRRPGNWRAVPPYLAMCYLYKRANWLWPFLIRNRLTGIVWLPLVEWSRRRHLRFRKTLAGGAEFARGQETRSVLPAAV